MQDRPLITPFILVIGGVGGKLLSRIVLALSFEHGPSLNGVWGGLPLSGMPLAQAAEDLGPLKVLPS